MALIRNFNLVFSVLLQLSNARAYHCATASSLASRYRSAFFHNAGKSTAFSGTKSINRPFNLPTLLFSTTTDDVSSAATKSVPVDNPLLRSWDDQPFNLPPFNSIQPGHFKPALESAMEAHIADLEAIASSTEDDFDSILGAYDRAGSLYSRVGSVYGNYISSLNTPEMQKVQTEMAPILSRHSSKCNNVPGLFEKIEKMYNIREDKLKNGEWTAEQARLAERVYLNFVRKGSKFDEESKKEYADIQGKTFLLRFLPYA